MTAPPTTTESPFDTLPEELLVYHIFPHLAKVGEFTWRAVSRAWNQASLIGIEEIHIPPMMTLEPTSLQQYKNLRILRVDHQLLLRAEHLIGLRKLEEIYVSGCRWFSVGVFPCTQDKEENALVAKHGANEALINPFAFNRLFIPDQRLRDIGGMDGGAFPLLRILSITRCEAMESVLDDGGKVSWTLFPALEEFEYFGVETVWLSPHSCPLRKAQGSVGIRIEKADDDDDDVETPAFSQLEIFHSSKQQLTIEFLHIMAAHLPKLRSLGVHSSIISRDQTKDVPALPRMRAYVLERKKGWRPNEQTYKTGMERIFGEVGNFGITVSPDDTRNEIHICSSYIDLAQQLSPSPILEGIHVNQEVSFLPVGDIMVSQSVFVVNYRHEQGCDRVE